MLSTFEKLNLKNHSHILVLNAPRSFEPELKTLDGVTVLRKLQGLDEIGFSLAFVTKQQEVDSIAQAIAKRAKGDAVVWFAYPKGTSKKYKSEINRDTGWQVLGKLGFEPVRKPAQGRLGPANRQELCRIPPSQAPLCGRDPQDGCD